MPLAGAPAAQGPGMIELKARAVLTDIEGTTTDIQFVHKTLFPYAREALPHFVLLELGFLHLQQPLALG